MNRNARALSGGRTGLIGVTLPMVHVEYFSSILWGASEALYEHNMNVVLCPTMHEREREVTLLDRLLQGTTDGALLMLTRESNDALTALERQGYPFVVLDPRQPVDERTPVVSAAHMAGAKAATEHLLGPHVRPVGEVRHLHADHARAPSRSPRVDRRRPTLAQKSLGSATSQRMSVTRCDCRLSYRSVMLRWFLFHHVQ